jgi:hypothetical protein
MANAQDCIKGVAKSSETKEPIPFAYILSRDGLLITYADVNGEFCVKDSIVDFIVYCMGYDSLFVNNSKFGGAEYYLNPKRYEIEEVEIVGYKLKPYNVVLQKEKVFPWTKVLGFFYSQGYIVTKLINGNGNQGRLKNIIVYTDTIGNPYSYFRIKLYKNNEGQLGEEITPSNIIARGAPNKYIFIDVANLNFIFPPEGLFVGVEIVEAGNQPYERYWGAQKNIKRIHYGPSLGSILPKQSNNGVVYLYNPNAKIWVKELGFIPLIAAEVKYFRKKK